MRWYCMCLAALLLAGCAGTKGASSKPEIWKLEDLVELKNSEVNYDEMRGHAVAERPEEEAWLRADVSIVDIDEELAKQLLGMSGPTDIEPRTFDEPMGEILTAAGCDPAWGEVLARPSFYVELDAQMDVRWSREISYLADWDVEEDGEQLTPLVRRIEEGVDGFLRVQTGNGSSYAVTLDCQVSQIIRPIPPFRTRPWPDRKEIRIQIPETVQHRRLGIETAKVGQTIVYPVSRAAFKETHRLRLVCVRLVNMRNS